MRTLLVTGYDDKMAELGVLTTPLMQSYASLQRFDFKCVRGAIEPLCIYWMKVIETIRALESGYDRVFWMDADQVVTNPKFNPDWVSGFHVSKDWGQDATEDYQFSVCGYVACADSKFILQGALDSEPFWRGCDFPEQRPIQEQFKNSDQVKMAMTIHPRKTFNAVPVEIHQDVVDRWTPNDFSAHLTMVPIAERVRLFHEIRKQVQV